MADQNQEPQPVCDRLLHELTFSGKPLTLAQVAKAAGVSMDAAARGLAMLCRAGRVGTKPGQPALWWIDLQTK